MDDEKESEYTCPICGEKFKTAQALASHKYYKHGVKPGKTPIEQEKPVSYGEFVETLVLPEGDMTSIRRISTKIHLEPEVFILYTYAVENGFRGSLDDFINACAINYMRYRAGVEVIVSENPLPDEEEDIYG